MDSIIGLLIVLIPVAFSLIGKKLENAGKEGGDVADVPPMPEVFPSIEEFEAEKKPQVVEEAVRVLPPKSSKKKAKTNGAKEEAKPQKKDPIDPKKLVIYSEIMKPKF